ncbi:MAG: Vms1/Ankzf1 family peptidyl-tRNA hydrolase [Euryarchaeota archaeon]|nr:Vms1/Ankzf1 family peptidyl-tRNA hydrolase [Euryarchaeota archaeon]
MFGIFNRKKAETKIAELQATVDDLESQNAKLRERLSKRDDKSRRAASERQDVETTLHMAENRIQVLEHELVIKKKEAADKITFRNTETLSKKDMQNALAKIRSVSSPAETLVTIYIPPGQGTCDLSMFDSTGLAETGAATLIDNIHSTTGLVIFHDRGLPSSISTIIAPPLPVTKTGISTGSTFDTAHLTDLIESDIITIVVIAHAGETFLGIADGDRFVDHKIIRSNVKEKHTKGGWSQRRFERLREEDISNHVRKAKEAFEEMAESCKGQAGMVITAGDRTIAGEITGDTEIPILFRPADIRVEKRNPEKVLKEIKSVRVYELP